MEPPKKEKRYSEDLLMKLKTHLAEIKPKPRSDMSARELVKQLASEIREAQEKGCLLGDIAQSMNEDGITITESTLRRYLQDEKRKPKPQTKASPPTLSGRTTARKPDIQQTAPVTSIPETSAKPGTFTPIQDPDTL